MSGGDYIGNPNRIGNAGDYGGQACIIGNGGGFGGGGGLIAHALGGAFHTPDSKANLQTKINDAGFLFLLSNLAGEIDSLPFKSTNGGIPEIADEIPIENSTALWAKQKIALSQLSACLWQSGFWSMRTGGNLVLASGGADTLINLDSLNDDFENVFNTGTDTFQGLNHGRYVFCASVGITTAAAGQAFIRIKKGGSTIAENGGNFAAAGTYLLSVSAIGRLVSIDTIRLYAFQNTGVNATLLSGRINFFGAQVSRVQ